MGVQDRDWWRERGPNEARKATYDPREFRGDAPISPVRGSTPTWRALVIWLLIGLVTFGAMRYLTQREPTAATPRAKSTGVPSKPAAADTGDASTRRAREPSSPIAATTFPAPAPASKGQVPIYRCGNQYTHVACAEGRQVDIAVTSGFDSQPSEGLARLVAESRASDPDTSTHNVTTTTHVNGEAAACTSLRASIEAIDRAAIRATSIVEQDRLRASRYRLRNQQIAMRCA